MGSVVCSQLRVTSIQLYDKSLNTEKGRLPDCALLRIPLRQEARVAKRQMKLPRIWFYERAWNKLREIVTDKVQMSSAEGPDDHWGLEVEGLGLGLYWQNLIANYLGTPYFIGGLHSRSDWYCYVLRN